MRVEPEPEVRLDELELRLDARPVFEPDDRPAAERVFEAERLCVFVDRLFAVVPLFLDDAEPLPDVVLRAVVFRPVVFRAVVLRAPPVREPVDFDELRPVEPEDFRELDDFVEADFVEPDFVEPDDFREPDEFVEPDDLREPDARPPLPLVLRLRLEPAPRDVLRDVLRDEPEDDPPLEPLEDPEVVRLPPDSCSEPSSLFSSSSPLSSPSSFFAPATTAGMATPSAAPATTFFAVPPSSSAGIVHLLRAHCVAHSSPATRTFAIWRPRTPR